MSYPISTFDKEYIKNLNLGGIKRHCNKCIYDKECRQEVGDHPLVRFVECDELQDYF